MTRPVIGLVIGTRPEVIKLSPVIDRLRAAGWADVRLLLSGQHGAMLTDALAEYGYDDENPGSPQPGDLEQQIDELTETLFLAMRRQTPAIVLVQGDTSTALAGARAAAAFGIPVAHVEAGLRTYDLEHPFPEEGIRQEIGRIASLHFAPTQLAADNLLREGVAPASVLVTGNTVVDALMRMPLETSTDRGRFLLLTLHRRELAPHVDTVLDGIAAGLAAHPDIRAIAPVHPNPAISDAVRARLGGHPQVELVDPLPHRDLLSLLAGAAATVTDSGGVQEEASILGTPLVIARKTTERPEVLTGGRARLAGFGAGAIASGIAWALALPKASGRSFVLGDGRAAERIEQALFARLRR